MEEIWKDIPGYEGRYQASTFGRIRSLDRCVVNVNGGKRLMRGRVLRPAASPASGSDHLRVVLGHGQPGSTVHSLVALTFLGPRPEGMEVRHLDGNAQNNHVDNLAYGSRRENVLDVMRIGKPWRILTAQQVLDIRKRLSNGERAAHLAREYGVKENCISAIKCRRTWAWLG